MENVLEIPQQLYDSEISFTISCFWDNGFDVALGVHPNFNKAARFDTYLQACQWLKAAAIRYYPDSTFAKRFPMLQLVKRDGE